MLNKTTLRPYRIGDAAALMDFCKDAKFLIGDGSFPVEGKHVLYLMVSERLRIVGLIEAGVAFTERIDGDEAAFLVTKLALSKEFYGDEYACALLRFLLAKAREDEVKAVYLLGEELPYEKELGFVLAAGKGIYDDRLREKGIDALRVKPIEEEEGLRPGFLHRIGDK